MPVFNMNAKSLVGTQVSAVALVKNGAVRIPFRMVKTADGKEAEMINLDLGRVGAALFQKGEKSKPSISAVIFSKEGYTQESAVEFMTKMGLPSDSIVSTETGFLAKCDGGPQNGDVLLKLDDNTGLMVSHVEKAFVSCNLESKEFEEVMKTEGFFPAMYMGLDTFTAVVSNIMGKAGTSAEAAQSISKAAGDFSSYMATLAQSLPESSFKAENLLKAEKLEKAEKAKTTEAGVPGPEDMEGADKKKAKPGKEAAMAKSEEDPVTTEATEVTTEVVTPEEPAPAEAQPSTEVLLKTLTDSLTASLTQAVGGLEQKLTKQLADSLAPISTSLESVTSRLDGVETQVQKADSILTKTLIGGHPAGDKDQKGKSKKSDGDIPYLDTAYMTPAQVARI